MLEASKANVEEVINQNVEVQYHEVADENAWRTKFVEEIMNIRENSLELPGFGKPQLVEILEYLCTG